MRAIILLAIAVVASIAIGTATVSGAGKGASDDAECVSCHSQIAERSPTFSHEAHAAGRACDACHSNVEHSALSMLGARLRVVNPDKASDGLSSRPVRVALEGSEEPGPIEDHRVVVCSTCHEMSAMKCATCHQAPAEEHFSDRCQKCHDPSAPFSEPQLPHPTFGAHVSATQSCLTCHIENGPEKPACRKCHNEDCGKGVTTIKGCLKCHKTGTAEQWIGARTSPN